MDQKIRKSNDFSFLETILKFGQFTAILETLALLRTMLIEVIQDMDIHHHQQDNLQVHDHLMDHNNNLNSQ
jgi:uncharacterized membrane protein